MEAYTGIQVVSVNTDKINQLYKEKYLDILPDFSISKNFWQNEYVVIKDNSGLSKSALTRHQGTRLQLLDLPKDLKISGVRPKNKEQWMAFDALLDDSVRVVTLTGKAGTGKTLLSLAAALHLFETSESYNKIILTRPMSWVGKHGLGSLPGDVEDKFNPYLQNYMCNIEHLLGGKKSIMDLIKQYNVEFIPIQLIRGASWANAIILADEVQVLGYDEMVALGTRVGHDSKMIIMGDLAQRDEKIARDKTGIHKFVNDDRVKRSTFTASIDLIKSERSEIAALFAEVFER